MGTQVRNVLRDNRWQDEPISVKQFAGPMRGEGKDRRMVQVTMRNCDGQIGFVQLTKGEAMRLGNRLQEWAMGFADMGDDLEE